jgi:ubiquinone/menaquinone biosynthesis C-methylase UbiE
MVDNIMYGKYAQAYNDWARCYDIRGIEINKILSLVDLRNKKIIDIGCGTGRMSFNFAPYCEKLVGIDHDKKMIDFANSINIFENVFFKYINGNELSQYYHKEFNIAFFSWSFNYFSNPIDILSEVDKVLTDKKVEIITYTTNGEFEILMRKIYGKELHSENNYLLAKKYFEANSFEIYEEYIEGFFSFGTIDEAIDKNKFLIEINSNSSQDYLEKLGEFRKKISKYCDKYGNIEIKDKVKLMIVRK